MVTAAALMHGDAQKLLQFDPTEHPVALQIGGSEPAMMRHAAKLGAERGYDEININIGCPSDRVQSGQFGACLMADSPTVAACVREMQEAVDVPVTIKTRIGIDDFDSYPFLRDFVSAQIDAGCRIFVVHARKAILEGLSPKENRTVPALDYDRVYRLKQEFPELTIVLNGGITTREQCETHLQHVDGVMIGRQAYHEPYLLAEIERDLLADGGWEPPQRAEVVERMLPYIERELAEGAQLKHITRHMLGLFAGQPGARSWRRHLSENSHQCGAGTEVVLQALQRLPQAS
jgi:tRNA-dihydrouridine synthase A